MLYLNQLDYPEMYYPTNAKEEGGLGEGKNNVKTAGCGLCSLCMIVENMTLNKFPLEECLQMSLDLKANLEPGTNLKILAPAVAEKFDLAYATTSDENELLDHLRSGGMAIANTGGDREGYNAVFSHGGHYIVLLSCNQNTVCVLDPSQKEDKFETPERSAKVEVKGNFIYTDVSVLMEDTANRTPSFYLFARK